MLRSLDAIQGYTIQATDGDIGHVHDFYFDDRTWTVRYLVVDTGPWLFGKRVLISPHALQQPEWATGTLPVVLTKEQVENSPDISADQPVSRQHEIELHQYYGWPSYWGAPVVPGVNAPTNVGLTAPLAVEEEQQQGDPNLRSAREVTGYHIRATDGEEFGEVDDFILDDDSWIIRYAVVDTRAWLPGKKVLLAIPWIRDVDWVETKVAVDLTEAQIKNSPEFDPNAPVNREYEAKLYDYYGRPKYWA